MRSLPKPEFYCETRCGATSPLGDKLDSTDTWLEIRKLRNQMVHEYVEDMTILSNALNAGHQFVPLLIETAHRLVRQVQQRLSNS